jgi:putative ABC transport system permease protein
MIAIALVMTCGVALFVTLRSMYGYLRDAQAAYYADYRFADVFARPRRAPRSLQGALAAIPGVTAVQTRIVMEVQISVPGLEEPATARLVSVPLPRRPMLNDLYLRRGRDLEANAFDEVLVNEAFVQANGLQIGSRFGAVINGRWQQLRIVGTALSPEYVYAVRPGGVFPDNRRFAIVWIGENAIAAAFNMDGAFNDVALTVGRNAVLPEIVARVDRLLSPYGGAGAFDREDQVSHRFLSDEIAETEVTSLLLPAIFLAVTAFLLNLVFGRLVATQRGQIAVLKAFGYSDRALGVHYLQLALVPIIAGGVSGAALGLWLATRMAAIYARFFEFPVFTYQPDWSVVAVALAVSVAAAVLGVVNAVRAAASLPPAQAMQPPAPLHFRHGLIERLGTRLGASPKMQMVLRSIERLPWRAVLSSLGTGCAVALVVTAWYLFDAIDLARNIQFRLVQREDVMVTFQDLRPATARFELARLPGVRRVEEFRVAPVRLRHGARAKRTTALGLLTDGELHGLVDRRGVLHALPRGGLLLTTFLAKQLDVEPGQTVTLEVLEGARPVREMLVAGLVDEVLGSSVYLSLGAFNDLMNDGRVMSGAFVAADSARLPALHARLKGLPTVSGVSVTETMRDSFDRTFAESFAIPIRLLVVFACIIASGIVYNGVGVALSERSRELATLRVLGFFSKEVEAMLLGEQALLTVIGLPVGFALGYTLCAVLVDRFETEMFRLPLVAEPLTYAMSAAIILAAAALSALAVRRRLSQLDLVDALKLRE